MQNLSQLPELVREPLTTFTEICQNIFQEHLVGVYVHGSAVMGSFNSAQSDLDLIVVVDQAMTDENRQLMIERLLPFAKLLPLKKGLEMSVVQEKFTKYFVYPTPFELHFGNEHISEYEAGDLGKDDIGGDPDLASHFYVVHERGVCVFGKSIEEVFALPDRTSYIDSNWIDNKAAKETIHENPIYVILNLCRFLQFLMEGSVTSKKEGGEWYLSQDGFEYKNLVKQALDAYVHDHPPAFLKEDLDQFAEEMLLRIEQKIKG